MARVGVPSAREPAFPARKGSRLSTDSVSRPHLKMKMRTASRTSGMEDQWADDAGQAPSPLNVDASRESSSFPEYSDYSNSPESKRHGGSLRSTNAPGRTPIDTESAWSPDSSHLMSSSGFNDSSEGLRSKHMKPKVHIKPMLRKLSRDDAPSTSIDLSRSSMEQEGLGIYMNFERDRRRSESITYRRAPSGLHHRSTSGTSQLSSATGSSGGKPAASQYVYPMRPTPRVYTPPLSQSYQTSPNDSDGEDDGLDVESRTESRTPSVMETQRTHRASSGPMPRLSLQIEDDSLTRLSGISQTNISSRPSFGYSRDNGSTLDTTSPTSRPSLDFVFRSRTRTSTDPVSRQATVQAARQAFEAKEAEKNRRIEKQQIKAEERETRRRVKRTQSEGPGPGPGPESPAVHSREEEVSEKTGHADSSERVPQTKTFKSEGHPSESWKSQSKSTWVLFMTWLRTRVFKFRRKLKKVN